MAKKRTKANATETDQTDKLTKLFDRATLEYKISSSFNESIVNLEVSSPDAHPYSVILFDVDYFKAVNDLFGYTQGDNILRGIGFVLSNYVRSHHDFVGILGRWGGEEFLMALPYTPTAEAKYIADEIRDVVAKYSFLHEKTEIPLKNQITISLGVSTMDITEFLASEGVETIDVLSQDDASIMTS